MATLARRLDSIQFSLLRPEAVPKPLLLPPPPPVEPGEREDLRQLRASLAATVGAQLVSATEFLHALETHRREDALPTMIDAFDALLGGGLPRGRVVELAGRRSAGRFSIILATLAAATSLGEAAALIDLGDNFDPQIAAANGVDLRRVLWIRPHTLRQAVMSAEMIAATGFQLVVVDAGAHPIRGRRVPDASWVRLARSAETRGTVLVLSTPYALGGTTPVALVAAHTVRAKWIGRGTSPRILAGTEVTVTLEKHRHLRPGKSATLVFKTEEAI